LALAGGATAGSLDATKRRGTDAGPRAPGGSRVGAVSESGEFEGGGRSLRFDLRRDVADSRCSVPSHATIDAIEDPHGPRRDLPGAKRFSLTMFHRSRFSWSRVGIVRHLLMLAATFAGLAAWMSVPVRAAGPADDTDAIASAFYGTAEIWLQQTPGDPKRRELVFKSTPDATPEVLDIAVPQHDASVPSDFSEHVALGLDRSGALTVVMQSRIGLYWTHVGGQPRLRLVPRTSRRDAYPSIWRGRLAFDHQVGTRSSVRVGSLDQGPQRTVWSNASDDSWVAIDTAIGADDAVAFVIGSDGADEPLNDALLARAGKRVVDLWPGDRHNGGLSLDISPDGHRLTVAAASSHTVIHYALPTGRRR
jgi:hypothetical protein